MANGLRRQRNINRRREQPPARCIPTDFVYTPNESKQGVFQTMDKAVYQRDARTGTIRRVREKMSGKDRKRARRKEREQAAQKVRA